MTDLASPRPGPRPLPRFRAPRPALAGAAAAAGLLALVYGPTALGTGGGPAWSLLAKETVALKLHLGAAVSAFLLGTLLMAGVKGRSWHKRLGWSWVAAMGLTAVSSFWLQRLQPGEYSWIHGLSGWTLVILPAAVYAARRKRIRTHRRIMTGAFYGGLLFTGAFAFLPGRLLWRLVTGEG